MNERKDKEILLILMPEDIFAHPFVAGGNTCEASEKINPLDTLY